MKTEERNAWRVHRLYGLPKCLLNTNVAVQAYNPSVTSTNRIWPYEVTYEENL